MTSNPLSPEALEAIQGRLAKITPGPWAWESIAEKSNEFAVGTAYNEAGEQLTGLLPEGEWLDDKVIERRVCVGMNESGHANFADADFIANAPADIATLLAAVETIQREKASCSCAGCYYETSATTGHTSAAGRVVQAVAELPDRTSLDDWPEAMLVTGDELHDIVERELRPYQERAIAERARVTAMEAEKGWQPIETAPKDLDDKLLLCNGNVYIGHWGFWLDRERWRVDGDYEIEPTHWMPLPALAADQKAAKEPR